MHFAQALTPFFGALMLASSALAIPQYGYEGYEGKGPSRQCQDAGGGDSEYRNAVHVYYYAEPELATATSCEAPCSISKTYTWTKGSIFTVGGSVGPPGIAEGLWKWIAGLSVNAGYSWTLSASESTSVAPQCNYGEGVNCGVHVIPRMVNITFEHRYSPGNSPACNLLGGWEEYFLQVPATKKTWNNAKVDSGKGDNDDVDITFGSCVSYCVDRASCQKALEKKAKICPEAEIPDDYLKDLDYDPRDFSDMLASLGGYEEVVVNGESINEAVGEIAGVAGIVRSVAEKV